MLKIVKYFTFIKDTSDAFSAERQAQQKLFNGFWKGDQDMEITSSLNKYTLSKTIFSIVGSFLFFPKQTFSLILSRLQMLIDGRAFFQKELKGRPIIFIMRPAASLTGCYVLKHS
ncbi:hypothetical protein LP43_2076 [Methylophaga thiooxydans]|uniref:Uncharacterized protein n=1 Tax=Methylophaga thiooxydans TaxID=392484 RepID=A0A0A0BCA2_9GAMM|nr:hypothetical protein LP43_2076 [Methylophaga thiooxydans]